MSKSIINVFSALLFMYDIVCPEGDEDQFVLMARRLGFSGLVMCYSDAKLVPKVDFGFPVKFAVVCPPSKIHSVKSRGFLAFCRGSEKARESIERSADLVFGVEDERKDSVHFRRSGLNQVLARLMVRKDVRLGFSFADVLDVRGFRRSVLLGRMMQNVSFARKFRFHSVIGSFASHPLAMRAPDDLRAFFHVLGMTPQESLSALRSFI